MGPGDVERILPQAPCVDKGRAAGEPGGAGPPGAVGQWFSGRGVMGTRRLPTER
jgi:hypothetical protein